MNGGVVLTMVAKMVTDVHSSDIVWPMRANLLADVNGPVCCLLCVALTCVFRCIIAWLIGWFPGMTVGGIVDIITIGAFGDYC